MTRNKSQKKKQLKNQNDSEQKHQPHEYFHVFEVEDLTCETCNRCKEKLQNIKFMIDRPFENNKYTHLCEKCFKLIRHNLVTKFNNCMYCGKTGLNMYNLRCISYKTNLPTIVSCKFCDSTCYYNYLYGLLINKIAYCITCGEKDACKHDMDMCRLCGEVSMLYCYGYKMIDYVTISLKKFYEKTKKTFLDDKEYTLVYDPKTDQTIKITNKVYTSVLCKSCHNICGDTFANMMLTCGNCKSPITDKEGYVCTGDANMHDKIVQKVTRYCSIGCMRKTFPLIDKDSKLIKNLKEHEKICNCGCKSVMDELD